MRRRQKRPKRQKGQAPRATKATEATKGPAQGAYVAYVAYVATLLVRTRRAPKCCDAGLQRKRFVTDIDAIRVAAREAAGRSRAAQGQGAKVTDPTVIAKVAARGTSPARPPAPATLAKGAAPIRGSGAPGRSRKANR